VVRTAPVSDPIARQHWGDRNGRRNSRRTLFTHSRALSREPFDRRCRGPNYRGARTDARHAYLFPSTPAWRGRWAERFGASRANGGASRGDAPLPRHRQLRRPFRHSDQPSRAGRRCLRPERGLRLHLRQWLRLRTAALVAVRRQDGPAQAHAHPPFGYPRQRS